MTNKCPMRPRRCENDSLDRFRADGNAGNDFDESAPSPTRRSGRMLFIVRQNSPFSPAPLLPDGLLRVVLWLINAANIGHAQVSRPRRPCHQLEANRKESNARTRCVLFSPQRAPFDRHFGTLNAILPARESTTYLQRERGFSAASSFIICIIIHEHSDVAPWSTTDNCIICRHCRPHTSSSGAFLRPNGVA
jgi:hypothetical protein